MTSQQRRLILLGIISVVFILIGWGVWSFLSRPKTETLAVQPLALAKDSLVAQLDNERIVFSNERGFVAYNFKNGSVQPLTSANIILPETRSLSASPSGQYLLFYAPAQYFSDSLGQQITQEGGYPSLSHWWVYSIKDQTFKHLEVYTQYAAWGNDDRVYATSTEGPVSTLSIYTVPLTQPTVTRTSQYKTLQAAGGSIYAEKINGEVDQLDEKGMFVQSLGQKRPNMDWNRNGSFALFLRSTGSTKTEGSDIGLYSKEANKDRTIAQQLENSPVWSFDGSAAAYIPAGATNMQSWVASSGKRTNFRLGGEKESFTPDSVVAYLGDRLFIVDVSESPYLVGETAKPPQPKNDYRTKLADGTLIEYNQEARVFFATAEGVMTDAKKAAALKQLRDDGMNPDFFVVRFRATNMVQNFGR